MSKKIKLTTEGIAQAEIGTTDVSPAVKWFLLLAFLCTIAAVPLVQYLGDLRAGHNAGEKLSLLPKSFAAFSFADEGKDLEKPPIAESGLGSGLRLGRLYNGKAIENAKKFESSIEEESWLLKAVGPSVEKVLIGMLGSGSRDVYCGRDGWLFFRPTIEYLTGPGFLDPEVMKGRIQAGTAAQETVQPDPVRAIVNFRNQLARRGIELVVLPSPAKATIYPERFSTRYDRLSAAPQNPSFTEFVRRLQAQGVRVFDPTPQLLKGKGKEELFLKTDTHWTPAGSELVARHLAEYLERSGLLPGKTPSSYPKVAGIAENAGDLAGMLKNSDAYGYPKQRVELHHILEPDGTPWATSRDADILFLGDSYANIFSLDGMGWGKGSGLVEQLSFQLRRPIDSILINDKGSFTTRQQLGKELKRGEDRLAGKKVVVYEFATRELALGNWKLIDMSLGKQRAENTVTAAASDAVGTAGATKPAPEGLQVEGVIEEITRPPRPGSTAYKDAVIAMHLKQVTRGGKPFPRSQIVVFCWGMRDDKATPASRYKRGERVSLKLRPWSQVESKYGSYQRIELQNDDAVFLDLFWLAQPEDSIVPPPLAAKPAARSAADPSGANLPAPVSAQAVSKPPPAASASRASGADPKLLFRKRLQEISGTKEQGRSYPGVDGWLFSSQELNHISKGQFWGEAAQRTSLAGKPESRDPLAAILDFKEQLERAGIELIVVPVPAKAHIYPDKLVPGIGPEQVGPDSRFDQVQQQFMAVLEKAGVDTLDLTQLFLAARKGDAPPVFLRNDTHWSPYGISLVARALKQKIAARPWFQEVSKQKFAKKNQSIRIKGDLLDSTSAAATALETVTLSQIQQIVDGAEISPVPDRNSPIVLLGDSHTLIFHSGGDMYAKDAGLPENLAYELGLNVDLVGVRGSGATPARVELARRKDNMAGKKLAIWCFTVREYTESQSGWRKVPVIR